ncbi:MAG: type II toxin-antitoxin system prevent-host-death family antitoxin [Gammaproteobacteria bacterium]|nr:MAG: type II toxin-antitoxin system prevent-host-death family antitoxin [Gammaproteobacteria bacterium]
MEEPISAADANRNFSQLLRGVREEGATYVVTSHGKPVAKIVPIDADRKTTEAARNALLARLASQSFVKIGPWSRDELYGRD